jgi:hypothetical protein
MSEPLYKLAQEYDRLLALLDDSETNYETAVLEIEKLQAEMSAKFEALLKVLFWKESMVEQVDAEIKRLQIRKQSIENRCEWIRWYLGKNLGPGNTFECAIGKMSWRKSEVVERVSDDPLLPEYERVKVEPNKEAIKRDLKAGLVVPGWVLQQRMNLQIK